jgi:hypothetical protein
MGPMEPLGMEVAGFLNPKGSHVYRTSSCMSPTTRNGSNVSLQLMFSIIIHNVNSSLPIHQILQNK